MSFTFFLKECSRGQKRSARHLKQVGWEFCNGWKSLIPNTPVLVLGVCWNQSRSGTRWRVWHYHFKSNREASPRSQFFTATIVTCSTNSVERYSYDSCGRGLATRLGLFPFLCRETVFDVISTILLHMCCHLERQVDMKIIQWGFALRYGGFIELQLQLWQRAS